ncbi:MAG: glycosyl hydrolase [Bryobacteraceae bacterium]
MAKLPTRALNQPPAHRAPCTVTQLLAKLTPRTLQQPLAKLLTPRTLLEPLAKLPTHCGASSHGVPPGPSRLSAGALPHRTGAARPQVLLVFAALLALACLLLAAAPATLADLRQSFEHPPDDARIMVRWWWFGPAVVKPELEREMRAMKDGGIGGFEVQPTYPLELDHNFPYLSDEFLGDLRFASDKAKELGLRFDLTLGSGWPFGGPHIPITEASGRLRVAHANAPAGTGSIPIPKLEEGEKFIAAYLSPGNAQLAANGNSVTLATGAPSGPGGDRQVLFFIASRTRQTVKRPAVGAEGYVLDHYSRAAIDTHLRAVGEKLLDAVPNNPPHAIFSDSLEVYNSDWTDDFLAEFQKRRGYDLTPYLPALSEDIGDKTLAIRHDWGLTLSELCDDHYLKPLTEWAHQHHTLFRSQTYGIPPVTLSSYQYVDLPEGEEGPRWRRFSSARWAASASHLLGRTVTSSETWTWLHSPVFRATPLDMKAEADLHFLQGINQFVGHGWPYSPPEAGEPGWRFYAAAVFNNHNPWYLVMPDVALYFQRISFLMRQGEPANDVAVYLPTADAFAGFRLGRDSVNQAMDGLLGPNLIPAIEDAGYNFDFIDDGMIAKAGVPYHILLLPNVERMPLATLEKIAGLAKKGVTVIATRRRPSLAPGLKEAESDTPQIRQLAAGLKLVENESGLGAALHQAMNPDVATARLPDRTDPTAAPRQPPAPVGDPVPEIGFVHRKLSYADIYFLVNTSNHAVRADTTFRMPPRGVFASLWDPLTGKTSTAGGTRLSLDLAPYESRVVVFAKGEAPFEPPTAASAPAPIDLSTGWRVTFPGSAAVNMNTLQSWTADESRKYFSGQATYEKTVEVPNLQRHKVFLNFGEGTPSDPHERRTASGMRALFDGPIREAAVVYVNGQRAGAVWCAPYEVEVTGLLKSGANTIRVVVANSALNILAKGPLPDYKTLTAKYGERFQAQDMASVAVQPSGLLGPVRLIAR